MHAHIDDRLLVEPYHRTPKEYRCASCGGPATGFQHARGVLMFLCEVHHDEVSDALWAITGADGSSGYSKVRVGWRYWVHSHWYRARSFPRRVLAFRKRRAASAQDAKVQAILDSTPTTPWGLRKVTNG